MYLASAGRDKQVIVWDITKKAILARRKTAEVLSALAWHPCKEENILAGIGEDGCVAVWDNVIPGPLPKPAADPDAVHSEHVIPAGDESNGVHP